MIFPNNDNLKIKISENAKQFKNFQAAYKERSTNNSYN